MTGYIEWTGASFRRRELPGASAIVILEIGPPIAVFDNGSFSRSTRHRGGFIAGHDDTFTVTGHRGFQAGIQLDLTPRGARTLIGMPLSEIAGRSVGLDDVLPRAHRGLTERLASLPTWKARFRCVEAVLLRRAAEVEGHFDPAAGWALRRIEASGGAVEIGALCRDLGDSPKKLIARFRDQVGVPPKTFARLVRFDRLLQHLRRGAPVHWSTVALDLGFSDQAHLIREVRALAGATPSQVQALLTGRTTLA